jgi:hypothetical protein
MSQSSVSFAAITFCVACQRVFIVTVVYFVIDSVRKLLDTPSYVPSNGMWFWKRQSIIIWSYYPGNVIFFVCSEVYMKCVRWTFNGEVVCPHVYLLNYWADYDGILYWGGGRLCEVLWGSLNCWCRIRPIRTRPYTKFSIKVLVEKLIVA